MEKKRGAIVLMKDLEPGAAVNVAAIAFAEVSVRQPLLFDGIRLLDADGNSHAAIMFNVVVLKANSPLQIANHARDVLPTIKGIEFSLFSNAGRRLSNSYGDYQALVRTNSTSALEPVALAIIGEDEAVRAATKKFSFYAGS